MTRSRLASVLLVLLLASAAGAQTFRAAGGPWTRAHELVGSAPDGRIFARVGPRLGVTRDGGRTWTVVSETAAPTRLVADGDGLLGLFGTGVSRSTDGGATWLPFGLEGEYVRDVAADGTLYAVTGSAAFRRPSGGDWERVVVPGSNIYYSFIDASGGTLAIAGSTRYCSSFSIGELLRSRDGGQTWTRSTGGPNPSGLAVGPDGTTWMTGADGQDCVGQPSTGSFHRQGPAEAVMVQIGNGDYGGVAVGANGQAVVSPGTPDGNAPYGFGPIESAGSSVIAASSGFGECGIDPPCFGVSGSGLFAQRGSRAVPTGFVASAVRAVSLVRETLSVAADGAVYAPDPDGWRVTTPLGGVSAFARAPWESERVAAVTGTQPYLLPSAMWTGEPYERYGPSPLGGAPASAAVEVQGAVLTAGNAFYSPESVNRFTGPDQYGTTVLHACQVASLGVVGSQTVYAGAVGDPAACSPGSTRVYRSVDAGQTWVAADAGLSGLSIYAFAGVSAGATPQVLAATSAGVFVQTGTATWQPAGLDGRRVLTFHTAPDGLLAGTDDGLFRRDAAGAWTRYGAGLDGRTVYAVLAASDASGAWLGAGTDAGLFQTRAFGVAAEAGPVVAAGPLTVETRPNPARGARTVLVSGVEGVVAVAVYDLHGRRVADLGVVEAHDGRAAAPWDAAGLAPGVYVVRATAPQGSASVRAAVVR